MTLSLVDWIIIGAYVVVTLAIGFAFSRRAGKSLNEFFVSGRALPWWIAGTSMSNAGAGTLGFKSKQDCVDQKVDAEVLRRGVAEKRIM